MLPASCCPVFFIICCATQDATSRQVDALQEEGRALTSTLQERRSKLYQRRQELVSGKSLPTPEELRSYHEEAGAAQQHHPQQHEQQPVKKGVPLFWLTALVNQDELAAEISSRDKAALAYCTSVRAVYSSGSEPTLEMAFAPNPFFSNSTLRRRLPADSGSGAPHAPEVTTDIDWKSRERTLTLRVRWQGQERRGGGGGGGRPPQMA